MKTVFSFLIAFCTIMHATKQSAAQNNVQICEGGSVVLKAAVANHEYASGGYIWYKNGQQMTSVPLMQDSLVITDTGSYTVATLSSTGCLSEQSLPLNVTYNYLAAVDDRAQTMPGSPVVINVIANDTTNCASFDLGSVSIVTPPMFGHVACQPDGSVIYVPYPFGIGSDSFVYVVKDLNGVSSNPATVKVELVDPSPVALEVKEFTVSKGAQNEALIRWTTTDEQDNTKYQVEKSADGKSFQAIATVDGKGSASFEHKYSYTDTKPFAGINFYRIKIIDESSIASYTAVKTITFAKDAASTTLYPNPAQDLIVVTTAGNIAERIEIYDLTGKLLLEYKPTQDITSLDINTLPGGTYLMRVVFTDAPTSHLKFEKR